MNESLEVLASILIHEGMHAIQHEIGMLDPLKSGITDDQWGVTLWCLVAEGMAFSAQLHLWEVIWGSERGMPVPKTSVELGLNHDLQLFGANGENRAGLMSEIKTRYRDQCGSLSE